MKKKKNKKFKKKGISILGAILILGTITIFYVGVLLGILYQLLLATGG